MRMINLFSDVTYSVVYRDALIFIHVTYVDTAKHIYITYKNKIAVNTAIA